MKTLLTMALGAGIMYTYLNPEACAEIADSIREPSTITVQELEPIKDIINDLRN